MVREDTNHGRQTMQALTNDTKVNSYLQSMKIYAAAFMLQIINKLTYLLGFMTIANVTELFAMVATGLAAANGLILLIKNWRRKKNDPADKN
jgi:ABC-type nitrate/sulfonate/bicarbonate transport system substrate-binding protein